MYIKLLGAGICFVLSLFNVLGAMQRVPVKTTVSDSSRPTVAMMEHPGTNLNWLSGGVFFTASIGLIAWAIWEHNSNLDTETEVDSTQLTAPVTPPVPAIQMPHQDETTQLQGDLHKNIIPFRRTADGSVPISQEQFENVLEDDLWSD
ncbi:MAG: hypothetical protein HC836_49320 [Richelia sp. RM2_1_2]|nr:hypothetical protein [Richelia sp. RM2_1_2]